MFLTNLNTEQQGVLLHLSEMMINADGNTTEEEVSLLDALKKMCSTGVTAVDTELTHLAQLFPSQKEKASLLLELIGVAHADADYHETESGLVREIATVLHVENELLEDMEAWVTRQFILQKEASLFMEEV